MPELVDICDQDGNLTGQSLARSEAHREELWHRSVIIWVVNSQGQILLQRRAEHLAGFPGLWDVSVDGHITAGEEPLQAAARELAEELGITAKPEAFRLADTAADRYMMTYGKMHQEYDFVFVVDCDVVADDLQLQTAEVLEVRWITPDQLERALTAEPELYSNRNPLVYRLAVEAARARR